MKDIIVIGGGGHAKVIISILKRLNKFNIVGYTDPLDKGVLLGVRYFGPDVKIDEFLDKNLMISVVMGIGKLKIADLRRKIYNSLIQKGLHFPLIIAPTAVINQDVSISNGTVIMDGVVINSSVNIGELSIINTKSSIDHDSIIGDNVHIAPGVTISGGVSIGENCVIGVGSTIIQSISICSNSFIGAGSVVVNNIKIPGKYFGIPARRISE